MRKNRIFPCAGWLTALALSGCAGIFYVPLQITAASPSQAVYAPGENPAVWVEFSARVDCSQAEQAFSLSEDSTLMAGRFSWSGNRLSFVPYEAFSTGHEYTLKIGTSVEDAGGNSLEREFLRQFRFGSDAVRPTVVDAYPATPVLDPDPFDHEILGAVLPTDRYHPVTVTFSEPVNPASFYNAFSISPDVEGAFDWPTAATAVFTPTEPYAWQTEYAISVSTKLEDLEGNSLADQFSSHFFVGVESDPPVIVSVSSIPPVPARQGESAMTLFENNLVSGWEADWEILVQFNEAVTEESVKTAFTFTPAWDYLVRYDPLQPDRVVLKRAAAVTRFRYGQMHSLVIKSGVSDRQGNRTVRDSLYHFNVNGPFTRPPLVYQTYYVEDAAEADPVWAMVQPLSVLSISNAPGDDPLETAVFDFYFECAERVTIPAALFAENFSIAYENSCIDEPVYLTIEIIGTADASTAVPPLPDGVTLSNTQLIVRVWLQLVNNSNGGSVTLTLARECSDQSLDNLLLHNPLAADWSLRVRDPD